MLARTFSYLRICWCFIIILVNPGGWSAAQTWQFKHIGLEEGLSQSSINCMLQDSRGFLWLGTQDGLNKYDGYGFKIYRADQTDVNNLSHSWIWDLFEDRAQNLWIATWHGLTKLDLRKNRFTQFYPDTANPYSISGERPTSICQDSKGILWIGTWGGGLNRYDPATNRFIHYQHNPDNPKSLPGNFIRTLYFDSRGRLWAGTWTGLSCITLNDEGVPSFFNFFHKPGDFASIGSNQITSIAEDHSGGIWIGSLGGGLNYFQGTDSSFHHFLNKKNDPASISGNDISIVYVDQANQLWVGTPANGLNLYERGKNIFRRILSNPDEPGSLISNNVYSIFEDRSGLLMIGAGGLNIYDPGLHHFKTYRHNSKEKQSLSDNKVTSFFEDQTGIIWIGTEGGGLNRFDWHTGSFFVYQHDPEKKNSLSNNTVSSVTGDPDGNIWIGTRGGGLNILDPANNKFIHINEQPGVAVTKGLNYINAISFTPDGMLWIATYNQGLIRYDKTKKSFSHFRSRGRANNDLTGNYLLRLFTDSKGGLWVGTWGAGLCYLNPKNGRFKSFLFTDADSTSISGNIIHSVFETTGVNDRTIWVGTSTGLSYMKLSDSLTGKFRHINNKDGLPSNVIYGILEDNHQNIWLSTNMGLSRVNPNTKIIKNFDVHDGLQSNEFTGGACLKLKDGNLLFGGVNGFNIFSPDKVKESTFQPPVVLTSFMVFNKDMKFEQDLNALSSIELSYKQNFFAFEFSALDYTQPAKIEYAYQMKGVDKNWVMAGKRRFASYTNINPGTYLFQVKGTNSDGIWSRNMKTLQIHIKPPYWRTWWFKLLGIVLFVLILYALHRINVQKLLAIERLRLSIASDLHDDIGSSLTRISITSEQIQNTGDQNRIRSLSKRIGTVSREVISTMSDIVWSIDSRNDSLLELIDRMHEYTYNDLSMKDMNILFHQEGLDKNKKIPVNYRQNIFYIFKETVNNTIKHSGATEIKINLLNQHNHFIMEIADNGKGFDPENISGGNGLRNIRMRAKRLKAELDIDARDGVRVILKMKKL